MVWSAVGILVPFHIYAHAFLSFLILGFFFKHFVVYAL